MGDSSDSLQNVERKCCFLRNNFVSISLVQAFYALVVDSATVKTKSARAEEHNSKAGTEVSSATNTRARIYAGLSVTPLWSRNQRG